MKRLKILSPILLSILAVISLWAANAARLPFSDSLAPVIFGLVIALVWTITFRFAAVFPHSYPLVASIFTFVCLFWNIIPVPVNIILCVIAIVIGFHPKFKKPVTVFTEVLPFILTVAIIFSLISGVVNTTREASVVSADYEYIPDQPNIYMIIPDRMPSPASMIETGIDCEGVVDALQQLGFVVPMNMISSDPYTPDTSKTPGTTRTMRFLADLLNPSVAPVPMYISYSKNRKLIRDSEEFQSLHDTGYHIVNVGSWFTEDSTMPLADENLHYGDVSILESLFYNELSATYFNRTIIAGVDLPLWQSDSVIQSVEQGRHAWTKDTIVGLAESGMTSTFTFAHIMLPHPPFVYSGWFLDSVTDPDQMQQYIYQIRYALYYILDLAQKIRAADPTGIIIIQSDEGMAFQSPKSLNETLSATQWSGVFGAWYVPGGLQNIPEEHYEILDKALKGL